MSAPDGHTSRENEDTATQTGGETPGAAVARRRRTAGYEVGALIRGASREVATEVQDLVREIEGYARDPARLRRDGADLDELRAALKERRVALLAKGIREQPSIYGR